MNRKKIKCMRCQRELLSSRVRQAMTPVGVYALCPTCRPFGIFVDTTTVSRETYLENEERHER